VIEYLCHLQEITAHLEQRHTDLKQELGVLKEQVVQYDAAPARKRKAAASREAGRRAKD
jgi:hypothetical protein